LEGAHIGIDLSLIFGLGWFGYSIDLFLQNKSIFTRVFGCFYTILRPGDLSTVVSLARFLMILG
jgi:hypothetical protein